MAGVVSNVRFVNSLMYCRPLNASMPAGIAVRRMPFTRTSISDIIRDHDPEHVLILSGDHIYKMDYGDMLAFHADSGADLTISCIEIPVEEAAGAYGVLQVNETGRVIAFEEKPENPSEIPGQSGMCLASMGNYVFGAKLLYDELIHDADNEASEHNFAKDIIPDAIHNRNVFAYPIRDPETGKCAYWRDVGTLDAYWQAISSCWISILSLIFMMINGRY